MSLGKEFFQSLYEERYNRYIYSVFLISLYGIKYGTRIKKKTKKVIATKPNIGKLLQETNFTKYHKIFMMQDKSISAKSDIDTY